MRDDISQFIENLLDGTLSILPKILTAVVVLLIGFLLGKLVQRLVRKLILYINEAMNLKLQARRLNIDLKSSASFISAAFFWVIISITILTCIHVLELDFLKDLLDRVVGYFPNIIAAIVIVFVGIIAGRLLGDLIASAATQSGIVADRSFLSHVVRYFILVIAIIIAADQLGIEIGFLIDVIDIILAALLFGAALAFGLGAKTSVMNILGSHYARKNYEIGTKIEYGGIVGTIVKISDHAVHLETMKGLQIIPSKDFSEASITIIREDE